MISSQLVSSPTSINLTGRVSFATVSILVTTAIFFARDSFTIFKMCSSPAPVFSFAGKVIMTMSTPSRDSLTTSFKRRPRRVRGLCMPGVSTNTA